MEKMERKRKRERKKEREKERERASIKNRKEESDLYTSTVYL